MAGNTGMMTIFWTRQLTVNILMKVYYCHYDCAVLVSILCDLLNISKHIAYKVIIIM